MNPKRSLSSMVAVTGLLLFTTPPVYSQVLEEVIVTAQKREQNVQDVPISVSAYSSDMLQERAIGDISGLANISPNTILDGGTPFSGSSAVLAAFIRGIGQNDFAMNFDPGVGIYLDGVYLARSVGANLDLPDVQRIEVLKGPQGSLFGRNTIGGAVNVVTRTPGDEFEFDGSVTGGRFDRLDARAFISLPLSNTLKSSLTFSSKNREGYQKRIPFPGGPIVTDPPEAFIDPTETFPAGLDSSDAEGGIDESTVRAKLLWEPNDRLSATIAADRTRIDQPAMPNSILATTESVPGPLLGLAENNIPGSGLDVLTGTSGFASFAGIYNFCINATDADIAARNAQGVCGARGTIVKPQNIIQGLGGLNTDGDPNNDRLPYDSRFITDDIDRTYATGQSFTNMETDGIALTVDFDISEDLALKSITAYRELDWNTGLDLDGSPIDILGTSPTFTMVQDQFSQELQFTGNALDGNLAFVVGALYFEEDGALQDTVNFSSGLLQILGPNDLSTENWGIFVQFDWRVSDLFGITLGGRYTEEEKTFLGAQTDNNGFSYKLFNVPATIDPAILTGAAPLVGFPEPDQPLRYFIDEEQNQEFENFDPRIAVQIYPADDLMFYGSYATGLKTGGWSTRLSNPLDFAPSFTEETVETWEIGMKAQFFDNRLQVNAAAFTSDFEDIQLNFQLGVSPTIQNAGDAEIDGVELEIVAAPIPNLMLNMSLGWIDAKFTDVLEPAQVAPNAFQAGVFPGAELPKTPEWQFNISPTYDLVLANGASVRFLVDYTYQSELWNDTERTFLLEREATDMLNANITYTSPDGAWDVVLGSTNLLDERYLTTGQAQIGGGQIYGTFSRPEEWYLSVRYRN